MTGSSLELRKESGWKIDRIEAPRLQGGDM